MTAPDPRMRWWGWGTDGHVTALPDRAEAMLRDELGLEPGAGGRPVALERVRLPAPELSPEVRDGLERAVGDKHIRDDRLARVSHAAGRSYPDLVRLRAGDGGSAPDAVVYPDSERALREVLAVCSRARVAVVPFGGGTSVVGGVEPLREGFAAAVSLDLARMNRVTAVDRRSLTATLQPGLLGPACEAGLRGQGLTLGHYPQSFEFSTVGGWVATRSAGQASTGYGRIDELVVGLRCASPEGVVAAKAVPASAAGPSIGDLLIGSEGVLGAITETTLRVRPLPEARRYEAWSFSSFEQGLEALRAMEQAGAAPDVARLSDEQETRLTLALASGGASERVGRRYLALRGHEGGCLAIVGFEGTAQSAAQRRRRAARMLRAGGAVALGRRPGRSWLRGRFSGPYLRDELLDRGVLVETLETAASWSGLWSLYEAVVAELRSSLAERGTRPLVMCHVSHLYPSGASLYFTFLARQEQGAELEQWRAAKAAASDAIVGHGGTITHHHAVGRDHAAWMRDEVGDLGVELLRATKARLDPAGIMNPGKLIPS